jgi:hypothetical protein
MRGVDLTMAVYSSFFPPTVITKAMFNFDEFGLQNFRYSGTINISVSDSFVNGFWGIGEFAEINWSDIQKNNIKNTFNIFSQFANLNFSELIDYDLTSLSNIADPSNVGNISNINISFGYPGSSNLYGQSSLYFDDFGYVGSKGDIFLNIFADFITEDDLEFFEYSKTTSFFIFFAKLFCKVLQSFAKFCNVL